jgi:hypothetical protein
VPQYDDALFDLRTPDLVKQDAGHAIIAHALLDQMLGTLILAYFADGAVPARRSRVADCRSPTPR